MKTATVNFKTDEDTKVQAQELSLLIGIPLGSVLHAYLREFVAKQEVNFSYRRVKQSRTVERMVQNLDESEREKMRKLLNKMHLKQAFNK